MKEIPDPRKSYNQRHRFLNVFNIAVLCGMDTWYEIHDWTLAREAWLKTFLELPSGIPSHDTFNHMFQMMDPEKFHDSFMRWTQGLISLPIDRKTMRRSREDAGNLRPVHVVSSWSSENSLVLRQLRVDEKTSEIKTIPKLLANISEYFQKEVFSRDKKE